MYKLLPGGVFTNAGANVKTKIVFISKGHPTKHIWYYDLSDLKINKGNPLTFSQFDDFFQRYRLSPDDPERNSARSWTVDLDERKDAARAAAAPLQAKACVLFDEADEVVQAIKQLRGQIRLAATTEERDAIFAEIEQHESDEKALRKQGRALQTEAQAILNAVYDLKAVNPNAADTSDCRTPDELLDIIEETQRTMIAGIEALRASRRISV